MLHTLIDLENFTLHAAIDDIGLLKDFYFEDANWLIQYFRIALGSKSSDRSVIVSPNAVTKMNREEKTLSVNISLAQIKSSPDADTYQPISNNQLLSCKTIIGYEILASDGHIGHVKEMLIDEETWQIRYLVIDTSQWWFGKHVILAPPWIEKCKWNENQIIVNLTRQQIKDSPFYDPTLPVNRQFEEKLHLHYSRGGYWESQGKK